MKIKNQKTVVIKIRLKKMFSDIKLAISELRYIVQIIMS